MFLSCTFLHEISFPDLWGGNRVQSSFSNFTELSHCFVKCLRTWNLLSEIYRFSFSLLLLLGHCLSFIFIVLLLHILGSSLDGSPGGSLSGSHWSKTAALLQLSHWVPFVHSLVEWAKPIQFQLLFSDWPVMISSECLFTVSWFFDSKALQVHKNFYLLLFRTL